MGGKRRRVGSRPKLGGTWQQIGNKALKVSKDGEVNRLTSEVLYQLS